MSEVKTKREPELPLNGGPLEEPHEVHVEEVPHQEPKATLPVPADNPLAMVRTLLESGERTAQTVELVERLVALEERRQDRAARQEFIAALTAFQLEVEPIKRTQKGTNVGRESGKGFGYWYAPLPQVVAVVREPLKKHGFAYRWSPSESDDAKHLKLTFHLTHIGGHSESNTVTMPLESKGGMSEQQKVSNALSFAMRLSMVAGLGLTTFDPDLDGVETEDREIITQTQADDLNALAEEAGVDKPKFLQSLGVEKFVEVKATQFPYAVQRLRVKIEKRVHAEPAS
jgi:hypothetical protein